MARGGQGQITAVRLWPGGGAGADHSSKTVGQGGGRGRSQQ